ncbi:hypothetical protein Tco_0191317 [Tanacetum coccineum]
MPLISSLSPFTVGGVDGLLVMLLLGICAIGLWGLSVWYLVIRPDSVLRQGLAFSERCFGDLHPSATSQSICDVELLRARCPLVFYYRDVDFSSVRGPLGLNKVITFEVLYRSLQIEPTVTLFRVFRLCANKRHPNAAIDDPRPVAGSFNMADVRRLSAHVINLRDMLEGVLVLSGLSRVWKSRVCDSVLRGADGNGSCYWYPSFKNVAKVEASQKRNASTSGAASSHVVKRTRSALAQSSGSTTRPSLFVGDDDACVEIPLVTPLRSAAVIPSSGNQGGSFVAPTAEGSNTRNSQGKGVMVDDVAAPSSGVSRPRPSFEPAPSFKDVSGDAVHTDFFPFSAGPYYATYPEGGVAGNCEFNRQDGELLARYRGLNQSHHEYVLSADSRLKGYEEKVANMPGLELQVAALKKQVTGLNDKLTSSDASFAKSKAKGKERKKKIKSLGKSLDNLHAEGELLSLAASAGFERGLSMHRTKDEFDALLNKMVNFMHGAQDRLAEASPLLLKLTMPFLTRFLNLTSGIRAAQAI